MKILFLCGRETGYPLNQFLIEGFRQFASVDVVREGGPALAILRRSSRVFLDSLPAVRSRRYDLVFVGFYGHLLMLSSALLSRCPVLFNPFISTYETLVFDRRKAGPRSPVGRASFWLDHAACRRADHILMDTQANIDYFSRTFSIPAGRFTRIYIGSDENIFYPRPRQTTPDHISVLYHGAYLPLQGIDIIIQAARLLNHRRDIRFRLLGRGLEYDQTVRQVNEWGLQQLDFLDPVPPSGLPAVIAEADICLGGHFGSSDKAARVIAGKTFQDIAMGKPTIVGDNAANAELLTHRKDAWFSTPSSPECLAEAIETLADDPSLREEIGRNAHQTFLQQASLAVIVPQLRDMVEQMIGYNSRRPARPGPNSG